MTEPLRILHVVESLERGGLERVVVDLVRAQRDAGHHVAVACLFARGQFGEDLAADGVNVFSCDKQPGVDWNALGRIRAYVRDERVSILHTHNAVACYYGAIATLMTSVQKRINTRHGMGSRRRFTSREMLYLAVTPLTHTLVAVSKEGQNAFEQRGTFSPKKSTTVVNGIPVEAIARTADAARDALRAEFGFAATTRVLGNVGRLNWAKDQATLLRAFRIAVDAEPDQRLLMVGDGKLRGSLTELCTELGLDDHVIFTGERPDVFELLGAMDVFVLSSVTEGYSIALLEASAAGLPIVATDVGGNSEIVSDALTGLLVPAKNPEALAKALLTMVQDGALRASYGAAGRDWAFKNASVAAMAAAYDALYRQ